MLQARKVLTFRFQPAAPPHLPFAVRSVGEYEITPESPPETPMRKRFSEIFWTVRGTGAFHLGRRTIEAGDGEIFFLLPGELHDIRAVSASWRYFWFTLDHPQSRQWLEAMGFLHRPLPARPCPVPSFRALFAALQERTVAGDRRAAHLAHGLLLAAMEGTVSAMRSGHPAWIEECRAAMDRNFADPQLGVDALARAHGVHRATLFRTFLAAHGLSPSQYLQSRRVHHAMELLRSTDLPVKEVAGRCGMNDANYLARVLRTVSGLTPRQFRAGFREVNHLRP